MRKKNDTILLDEIVKEDNGLMVNISNELGYQALWETINNPKYDYIEGLKAFRIFCMLRMNKDGRIYNKNALKQINYRYKLLTRGHENDNAESKGSQ